MHISPIKRRVTRKIRVGSVYVGGDAPIITKLNRIGRIQLNDKSR